MVAEEVINYYAKARVDVRKIASAAGFVALLWSSVVLLGGFVSVLTIKDFWSLSVLSLVMASNTLELLDTNAGGIYVAAEKHILRLSTEAYQLKEANKYKHWTIAVVLSAVIVVKTVLVMFISSIYLVSTHVSIALSVLRLVQQDYGGAGGDAANKAKLNAALIIFYVLVIFHGLSVLYWGFLNAFEPWIFVGEQLGFVWGPKVVRKYRAKTRAKCLKDGVLPSNWNLITFSVGLLESASQKDCLWGARVLDTFSTEGIPIRQELLSSSQAIQNLIDMTGLSSTEDNTESRERAARIVAALASELRITQFPDALRCICGLLESCSQYGHPIVAHLSLAMTKQTDHKQVVNLASGKAPKRRSWIQHIRMFKSRKQRRDWERYFGDKYHYSYASKGTKELITQGLVILERLTQDKENCIEIIKHQRLLSKITLSLSYRPWGEILTVVNRLISAALGEDTARLRHDISRNAEAVRNLMRILEGNNEGARRVHERTIEILTELSFDDSFRKLALTEMFIKTLRRIFLEDIHNSAIVEKQDEEKYKRVRRKAGEALARLLHVPSSRDSMTSTTNVYVVDLLPKHDVIDLLTKVVDRIISSKAKKAADAATQFASSKSCPVKGHPPNSAKTSQSSTQEDEEQDEERKLLAAMLSLTVAICNQNVITGDEFTRAIPDDVALVKKLKEIVEMDKDATTGGWRILKLVCQVVIAMVQLKATYIREFNEHNFKEALSNALKTMSDVDICMTFAWNDWELPARSLDSLVKEVHELLAEEQGEDFSD